MKCNALTKVEGLVIERLPVSANSVRPGPSSIFPNLQAQLQIMLQIHTLIRARGHTPERAPELSVMDPDLDISPIHELIQTACMIQMQMPDNDLLDILNLIPSRLNRGPQLMSGLILDSGKHIRQRRPPHLGIILPTARLPENESFVRMLNEDTVARELATFVHEGLGLGGFEGGVAASKHEGLIAFKPSYFEDVKLRAFGADVGYGTGNGTAVELALDCCHDASS
jgi:hypothetical protein